MTATVSPTTTMRVRMRADIINRLRVPLDLRYICVRGLCSGKYENKQGSLRVLPVVVHHDKYVCFITITITITSGDRFRHYSPTPT